MDTAMRHSHGSLLVLTANLNLKLYHDSAYFALCDDSASAWRVCKKCQLVSRLYWTIRSLKLAAPRVLIWNYVGSSSYFK